jgi:hypothetical protein
MYRIPRNLGGRIPEKSGMNELAKRACEDNNTGYSLQFDNLCYFVLLAIIHKVNCFLSDNMLSLWKDTALINGLQIL